MRVFCSIHRSRLVTESSRDNACKVIVTILLSLPSLILFRLHCLRHEVNHTPKGKFEARNA